MNTRFFSCSASLLTAVALFAAAPIAEAITLDTGEVDIGVQYQAGNWIWTAYNHESDEDFTLGEALFRANASAQRAVPNDPDFTAFLGVAGTPVWVLPSPEEPGLLFLGLAADRTGGGIFQNNRLDMTLTGVAGPGEFALYSVDAFGEPQVLMNSRDGLSAADRISLPTAGGHAHANWAFSEPGSYTLTVLPSGTLAAGNVPVSGPAVQWNFQVVPEPGSAALLVLGGLCLARRRRVARACTTGCR